MVPGKPRPLIVIRVQLGYPLIFYVCSFLKGRSGEDVKINARLREGVYI